MVHVCHIPVGIGDSNMAARTSRDRWVRGSHVGRCARLEITSSRSWNARGWQTGAYVPRIIAQLFEEREL